MLAVILRFVSMTAAQHKEYSGFGTGTWATRMHHYRFVEIIIVTSMASRAYTIVARHVTEVRGLRQLIVISTVAWSLKFPTFQFPTSTEDSLARNGSQTFSILHRISESLIDCWTLKNRNVQETRTLTVTFFTFFCHIISHTEPVQTTVFEQNFQETRSHSLQRMQITIGKAACQ